MKKTRLFLSVLLCLCLLGGTFCPAAAETGEARLYNVYGDHMLFQQNADAVFAGEAAPGTALSVTLTDKTGAEVQNVTGTARADGTFSLSFPAPAGSFDPYTVTLTAGGEPFFTLNDVVFGELWLSFGQSNMEYSLALTPEGKQMQAAGKTGSSGIHVLQVPHPVKNGAFCADALPQTDAQNCHWYTGDSSDVFSMSAVAYFFAEKLLDDRNVPIGVLNAAVGGSGIAAWLPREAIEADPVKEALKAHDSYIPLSDWDKGDRQFFLDMTGLYNSKIAPLTNFRPQGAIWYQGETDFMRFNDPAYYEQLFTLMQDSYTAAFSHESGRLPLVFTQLVSYNYGKGPYEETRFNEAFTRLAAADPASRSEVVISDLSPDYYDDCGSIHPMTKKPIGERMAGCAEGLVCGTGAPTSSPAMNAVNVQGEDVLVTFSNVGDGLVCSEKELRGFSVYGADGVCCVAEAEIISANTVRVHSDAVATPVGATYAVGSLSPGANLWSSFGGERCLPAASFGASDPAVTKLFDDAEWLRCDTLTAWQNSESDPGIKEIWTAEGASLSVTDDAAQGSGALKLAATSAFFSVTAPFAQKKILKQVVHDNLDTDFSSYGTLTVQLKNTGKKDVTLTQLRLYTDSVLWFTPLCIQSKKNCAMIPADGAWHSYTFDLNELGLCGGMVDRWSNDALQNVTALRLCFFGSDGEVQADDFRFAPETQSSENGGAFLQRLIARIVMIFNKLKAFFAQL